MKTLTAVVFAFFVLAQAAWAAADGDTDDLGKYYSPEIQGETLVIKGRIDSHIYDYLSMEAQALKAVKVVELNSFGGNSDWALQIAEKLKSLGKTTRLSSGHYCASACVYLFAAGKEREADRDTWLGIHGARLGAGYSTTFQGLCFVDMDDGTAVFTPKKRGCQEFLDRWYQVAMDMTLQGFASMESSGVSASLRETYLAMPDDPEWPQQLNVIRKPDWVLSAEEAQGFNLVTRLKN